MTGGTEQGLPAYQAVAFLPNLRAQWSAEDPDLYRYAGGQAEPEALELMLRELFWEEARRSPAGGSHNPRSSTPTTWRIEGKG